MTTLPTEEARRRTIAASEDVDELLAALGDESWRVRKEAATRIAGFPDVAGRLCALLGDHDVGRRAAAADALAGLGSASVPPLLDALAARAPHRRFVIDALGAAGDAAAVPALASSLHDPDENVRAAAAEALGILGGAEAQAALRGALAGGSLVVRHAALAALARAGAALPLAELTPLLDEPMLRPVALALLGRTGGAAPIPWLIDALRRSAPSARAAAVHSLDSLPAAEVGAALRATPDVEPILVAALDGPQAAAAARLLGVGRFPGAAVELVARLGDGRLEGVAAEALIALGGAAVPALAEALQSDDLRMAAGAAHILGDLRAPEAAPALVGALARDDEVAAAATRALAVLAAARPEAVRPHLFPLDARRCRVLRGAAVAADRPALLLALREGDAPLRAAAAGVLGLLDPEHETREALVLALADEDARVRAVAAGALGSAADPAAAAALESATGDPESEVRAAAARALGQLGMGAPVLRALVATGGRPAVEALEALARLRDPADVPRFRAALASDDAEMVKIAIRWGNLPGADILPLLDHARWDVRAAAVEALRGVEGAAEALASHRRRETDPLVLGLLERSVH